MFAAVDCKDLLLTQYAIFCSHKMNCGGTYTKMGTSTSAEVQNNVQGNFQIYMVSPSVYQQ